MFDFSWEPWSGRLGWVQVVCQQGNMETVIHQRVIIRLLTTFTAEIRTAAEPGRLDWQEECLDTPGGTRGARQLSQ